MAAQSQAGTAGILLVCGAPGSGKSTVCRGLLEKLGGHCRVVSVDELYDAEFLAAQEALEEGTISASQTAKLLKKARMHAVAVAGAELEAHRTVLVDDTFHLPSLRKPYFNLARASLVCVSKDSHRERFELRHMLRWRQERSKQCSLASQTLIQAASQEPLGRGKAGPLRALTRSDAGAASRCKSPKSMHCPWPKPFSCAARKCKRTACVFFPQQIGLCIKQVRVAGGDAAAVGKALAQAKSSLGRGDRTVEALKKAVQQSAAHDIVQNVLLYLP